MHPFRSVLPRAIACLALSIALAGLSAGQEKPPARPETDPLRGVLEKLKKDLGDDPEALKRIDELMKQAGGKPAPRTPAPVLVPRPAPLLPPVIVPGADPFDDLDALEKELVAMQGVLQQQLGELMKHLQGAGGDGPFGGIALAPNGVVRFGVPAGEGRLGIRVEKPSPIICEQLDLPNGQGLVCVDVPADSVAGRAGIKPNDILMEIAGKPVPSSGPELLKNLRDIKPDAPVDIVILRKGKPETIKGVKLPEAREEAPPAFPMLPGGLPQLRPLLPAIPGIEALPPIGAGPPPAAPPIIGADGARIQVEQFKDSFTIQASKGGVRLTITGSKESGSPVAESIEVEADGKTMRAESIDKLPKEYQEMARSALKSVK